MAGPRSTPGGTSAGAEIVYSDDRVRRIRWVLYVVLGLSFLLVLLAALVLLSAASDSSVSTAYALVLAGIAVVLLASTTVTLRLLPRRGRQAKLAAVMTGVLLVLFGLFLASVWIGLVMPLLGLAVLLIALLPDQDHL